MIFVFDAGGYYLWFSLLQNNIHIEVRQEIEKGLKDDELVLIKVPANSDQGIEWIKPGQEFRLNKEMYDVVRSATVGKEKYYYCLNDAKEKKLIAGFTSKSKKNSDKRIRYSFSFQYVPIQFNLNSNINIVNFIYPSFVWQYKSNTPDIHSPPPKTI